MQNKLKALKTKRISSDNPVKFNAKKLEKGERFTEKKRFC